MSKLLTNQKIFDIVKKTLDVVINELTSHESSSFNEASIKIWLEKWSENNLSDVKFNCDDINLITKNLLAILGKIQSLDVSENQIKLKVYPADKDTKEVVSQEVNAAFNSYLKKLNLFNDYYNSVGEKEEKINPLDEVEDLPKGWILNQPDRNELDKNDDLNYWKSEIVEMHDRIRRRCAGEEV